MQVMEVLYNQNRQLKFGIFLENKWKDIVNAFFIEGNMEIPKKLEEKSINNLTNQDYIDFFKALDYTVIGISKYDPNVHVPSVVSDFKLDDDDEEKETPLC